MAAFTSTAESGNQVRRRFCSRCGSHLFADNTGRAGFTVVRVGTLDDPSSVKPVANIWSASAPDWACLDPGLPRIERQPPSPQPPMTRATRGFPSRLTALRVDRSVSNTNSN